jgi:cobyrinic acid a,c-diamide synthase
VTGAGVPGLIVAAPASGSGKTLVTLGLMRALVREGYRVAPFKTGPDYIDPAFLAAAAGRACVNLDTWAMRPATLAALVGTLGADADLVLGEGVMGLFDGGPGGAGSTAELAARTGWPVVLVIDAKGMGASAGALVAGFARHRPDVVVAGVIANRVGGARHGAITAAACADTGVAMLGALPRDAALALPSRHLGLVQATEHAALDTLIERAAAWVAAHVDLAGLRGLARPARMDGVHAAALLAPPGQRIALAQDPAFAFAYSAQVEAWRRAGAAIAPFSPLADQAPDADADAVVLPGGYPELHAGRLAGNARFLDGVRAAAARGATVYGECGGYMVLGEALIDGAGARHAMAGLLPLVTSFAAPKLHLGYRQAVALSDGPFGAAGAAFRGHEFHYATTVSRGGAPLFRVADAEGQTRGDEGIVVGRIAGSFLHLIDYA